MYGYVYIEINILSILILMYMLYKIKSNVDQQLANVTFYRVIFSVLIILVLDCVWILVEGKSSRHYIILNYLINASYLFQTGVTGYCWFYFIEGKLKNTKAFSGWPLWLMTFPLVILFLLSFTSPWTKLLFYIDEYNVYHRGDFHFLQVATGYFYLIGSGIQILKGIGRTRLRKEKREMLTMLSFYLIPATGGVISALIYGVPTIFPPATLALLMVYINFQGYEISIDGLTGLNNRRQFDVRLQTMISENRESEHPMLLMMDIDSFKQINDTYGHFEGDRALMETASILKNVCNGRNVFLCRYGGDEFAILCSFDDVSKAYSLKEDIIKALKERNQTQNNRYDIMLSIGIEELAPGHAQSAKGLISGADIRMYSEKSDRKKHI